MTLKDRMPHEFSDGEFHDTRAWTMRDVKVVVEFDGRENPWPGNHRNVFHWVELENGYLVGLNENPAIGWSFPVMKKPVKS